MSLSAGGAEGASLTPGPAATAVWVEIGRAAPLRVPRGEALAGSRPALTWLGPAQALSPQRPAMDNNNLNWPIRLHPNNRLIPENGSTPTGCPGDESNKKR